MSSIICRKFCALFDSLFRWREGRRERVESRLLNFNFIIVFLPSLLCHGLLGSLPNRFCFLLFSFPIPLNVLSSFFLVFFFFSFFFFFLKEKLLGFFSGYYSYCCCLKLIKGEPAHLRIHCLQFRVVMIHSISLSWKLGTVFLFLF